MQYSQLCETYEELEQNPSRLKKTEILANFLKELKEPEVIYLLQGKVYPDYSEKEFGISEKLCIKALERASGISNKEIVQEWKELGDLGKVAEKIMSSKKQNTLFSHQLTTQKVLENLQKLPELVGKGTVDKKLALISELLTSASGIEAKYIIRTLLNQLRIGVASGTIRDSIVESCFGKLEMAEKKQAAEIVQNAYDKATDFAEVFDKAGKGLSSLKSVKLIPGKPIKAMLALKAESIEDGFKRTGKPAVFEYKYDGFRCISGYTKLYIKNRGLVSARHITTDDQVLTHKGKFRKILAINRRKIDKNERLFEIQSFYGNKFKVSEGHPILVYRNKPCWVNIESITKKDKLMFPIPKINATFHYKKELILKDESGYSKKIKINSFFFRFLGYWIGDGFTNDYHNTERVGLIFNHKKEKKLCKEFEKNIKKYFNIEKISKNIHNGAIYLYWRDKPLRIWLSKYFRREWKGKTIPSWFFGINKKQFESFLNGWIESDGHTDKLNRTNIHTKERDLAMFASLLGLQFQKMIGIKKLKINKKDYYRLILPKSKRGFSILNKKNFLIDILRINEIKNPYPRTNLYNLQVEGDESYCSSMVTLHNCMINKDEKGEIKIFTRRLDEVTKQFPEIVDYIKEHVNAKSFIIDSEAIGFDPKTKKYKPFEAVSQRIKRKHNIEKLIKELPVEINAFDILYLNGKALIDEPFEKRTQLLRKLIKPYKYKIRCAHQLITSDAKKAEKFYKEALKDNQEGLMIKNPNSKYQPGARVGHMLKLKPAENELDLVITGAEYGKGKRAGAFATFTLSCLDEKTNQFKEIGKSSGLKEKSELGLSFTELTKKLKPLIIKEHGRTVIIKPKIVVTILYQNIQRSPTYDSGFALRFPRIIKLRPDKHEYDINTLKEILHNYQRHELKIHY